MINLLVRKPHTSQYVESLLDADVYSMLVQEGWSFTLNEAMPGKPYVKIHRQRNGVRQTFWLHRFLAMATIKIGHFFEIHHCNFNTLDNQTSNLLPLLQKDHRRLHAEHRRASK